MVKKKVIWFVNKDAAPIDVYATHLRTVKQAQYFQEKGYDVKLICSANVHNTDVNYIKSGWFLEQTHNKVPFVFIKSLQYGRSGFKRILAYILFSLRLNRLCYYFDKPDIIIHTSRIPFDLPIYWLANRIRSKYILDITDLWPMEFEHFGFIGRQSAILRVFYSIEKFLYARAEHVVMSMEGGRQYIQDHKWNLENGGPVDLRKIHYVNNGIDLDEFNIDKEIHKIIDADLEDESIDRIIYLGSIRHANNVAALVEAAKYLQDHPNLKILIYGDGPERPILEEKCIREEIKNVVFKQKWVEPKYVPYILSKATINILNYAKGWAPYGGSMNKMFMAIACGRPILCNAGMRFSIIRDNNLGIDKCFDNNDEYASAILELINMPKTEILRISERSAIVAQQFHIPNLNKTFQDSCDL